RSRDRRRSHCSRGPGTPVQKPGATPDRPSASPRKPRRPLPRARRQFPPLRRSARERTAIMRKILTILTSIGILLAGIAFSVLLWITKPEAEKDPPVGKLPTAEVIPVEPRKVSFNIP